jgi:hypothetical protein
MKKIVATTLAFAFSYASLFANCIEVVGPTFIEEGPFEEDTYIRESHPNRKRRKISALEFSQKIEQSPLYNLDSYSYTMPGKGQEPMHDSMGNRYYYKTSYFYDPLKSRQPRISP